MKEKFQKIKLIVGLGNIGQEYTLTRHNAGFMFADTLLEVFNSSDDLNLNFKEERQFSSLVARHQSADLYLAKPTTLMNNSGKAVSALLRYYKLGIEELLIVHDDMDIELGNYKIQLGTGPKVHNGLSSIERELSSKDFLRLRLGIENREQKGNKIMPGKAYALQNFLPDEADILYDTITTAINELI